MKVIDALSGLHIEEKCKLTYIILLIFVTFFQYLIFMVTTNISQNYYLNMKKMAVKTAK